MTARRTLVAVVAALLVWAAAAAFAQDEPGQVRLSVQGVRVPGATTALVPGSTYAPAPELAAAMGAAVAVDNGAAVVTFTLGARTLALAIGDDPAAAEREGAIRLDGRPIGTALAVRPTVEVFVPVAPVLRAFGGSVHYLGPEEGVVGVLPRATVASVRFDRIPTEALRIDLSAPVPVATYRDDGLGTVQIRIARTSLERAQSFEGNGVVRASVFPSGDGVDVRIQLASGARADVVELPAGTGFQLAILVRSGGSATPASAADTRPLVVLDPWRPLAATAAAARDAERTLAFSQRLATALRDRGADVRLTRESAAAPTASRRAALAADADLFVSLHVGDASPGSYALYRLGEADDLATLDAAIRRNAAAALAGTDDATEDATSSLRRDILLDLLPDLDTGRRYADVLRRELLLVGGYATPSVIAAPLLPLADAAGRGLLLEFAPTDLVGDVLVEPLVAAIATVLADALP